MHEISKSDVVGARIVAIHQTEDVTEGGLDHVEVYFTVDRGFTFTTPTVEEVWCSVDLPPTARKIVPEFTEKIKGTNIAGIYLEPPDHGLDFWYPNDAVILLEDGTRVSNTRVSPHGTGAAGLYVLQPSNEHIPIERLVDFFSVPRKA